MILVGSSDSIGFQVVLETSRRDDIDVEILTTRVKDGHFFVAELTREPSISPRKYTRHGLRVPSKRYPNQHRRS